MQTLKCVARLITARFIALCSKASLSKKSRFYTPLIRLVSHKFVTYIWIYYCILYIDSFRIRVQIRIIRINSEETWITVPSLLLSLFMLLSVAHQRVLKCQHHALVAVKAAPNTTDAQNVDHDFSSCWKQMLSVKQGCALLLVLLDITAFEIRMWTGAHVSISEFIWNIILENLSDLYRMKRTFNLSRA